MLEWFWDIIGWKETYDIIPLETVNTEEVDLYINKVINEIREEKFKQEYKVLENRLTILQTQSESDDEYNSDNDNPSDAIAIPCL